MGKVGFDSRTSSLGRTPYHLATEAARRRRETTTTTTLLFFTFTFVYRLYHFGRRGKKETFVCCTSECLGRRNAVQKIVSL